MAILNKVLDSTILFEHDSYYNSIRDLLPPDTKKLVPEVTGNVGAVTVEAALRYLNELAAINDDQLEKRRRRQVEFVRHQVLSRIINEIPEAESASDHTAVVHRAPKKKSFLSSFVYFWFLVIGGSVLAICNGITGITSILSWFSLSQQSEIIVVSIFSGLSMFTYFANDLKGLGIVLEIPFRHVRSWLSSILEQQTLVLEGYNRLNHILRDAKTVDDKKTENASVKSFYDAFQALEKRLKEKESKMSNAHIHGYLHKGMSYALLSLSAIVYGSGGYFVGRQTAVVLLNYISYSAIGSVSLPLMVTLSGICSIVSLALFYWQDFPSIISYINLLSGIPDDLSKEFADNIKETRRARERLELSQKNDWFAPHANKLNKRIVDQDADIADSRKRILKLLNQSQISHQTLQSYDNQYKSFKHENNRSLCDLDSLADKQEAVFTWLKDVEAICKKDFKIERRFSDLDGALASKIERAGADEKIGLQSMKAKLASLHDEYKALVQNAKTNLSKLSGPQAAELLRSQKRFNVFLTQVHHKLFFAKPVALEQFKKLADVPVIGPDEPDFSQNDQSFLAKVFSF